MSFKPKTTSLNKNNGAYSTLDTSFIEGFVEQSDSSQGDPTFLYSDFGYSSTNIDPVQGQDNIKAYARDAIDFQIKPLEKLNERFNYLDDKIAVNKASLESNVAKYTRLRAQLEEIPDVEERTINVGTSPDSSKLYFEVPNVDMSYQRIRAPEKIDKTNEASNGNSYNGDHIFSVKVDGRTLVIEKTTATDVTGWDADDYPDGLKFNIGIETIPDKKYFHHKDDPLEINRRKNQREQHMADTKELLLYTNQFYIIGTISTALVLIFAYRNVV